MNLMAGEKSSLKKGQASIFIIVAIAIVAGVIIYFAARGGIKLESIPADLEPVFSYYEKCIEEEGRAAIDLAGSQGGYVNVPEYLPGSDYAPFSSHLNFLGFSVPYWYYISGNGVIKEQMPSKGDIESNIEEYLAERVENCDFDEFYSQGYSIELGKVNAEVALNEEDMKIDVNSNLVVSKGEERAAKKKYSVELKSKLGKFYGLARDIYDKERKEAIFDNYAVDILRLYSPVDGVEVSCSGKIWKTREVLEELKKGIEGNIGAIKFNGNYYDLKNEKNKYFVVKLNEKVDEQVNLIYSNTMPTKIEINGEGVSNELMIAKPVGTQEGLGILGFCYAPYHFVYDVSFPILVQIYDNSEIFQFPIVVIVDNNMAREAVFSELEGESEIEDLCEFGTQDVEINLYDSKLDAIDGDISYQCFDKKCNLGRSENGKFAGKVPSCLNGQLLVNGEGFTDKKVLFSSNKENTIDIILDRRHEVEIELRVGGKEMDGMAIVSFDKEGESVSTALPEVKEIKLSEGLYNLSIYVYGNSSIKIPASKKTECQEIPRSGILGFFGGTKEECFEIAIPETIIDYALRGGGKGEAYLFEEQLQSGKLVIDVDELPVPKTLEELQYNYGAFDNNGVVVT